MMQEDSNGESSFEFVHKKVDDPLDVTMSNSNRPAEVSNISPPMTSQAPSITGNLLSSVPPPSALPSFIVAQPPPVSELKQPSSGVPVSAPSNVSGTYLTGIPPVSSQPMQYPAPSFSAAIPYSPGTEPDPPASPTEGRTESSLIGWVKGAVSSGGILSRVAEKAKSSVDSMITTLDPQMREFIYSGGDIDIVVASEKEVKISPIREAFQAVFGRATITGQEAQSSMVAAQPVGFAAGCRAAEERIAALRQSGNVPEQIPVVAVENFLLEVSEDKWFDLGVLILDDPVRKLSLQTFTQLTPVPARVIERAQVDTPSDYPLRWSGLAVPVGKLMAEHLQVSPSEWHCALTGVTRREMLLLASKTLAGLYKNSMNS